MEERRNEEATRRRQRRGIKPTELPVTPRTRGTGIDSGSEMVKVTAFITIELATALYSPTA